MVQTVSLCIIQVNTYPSHKPGIAQYRDWWDLDYGLLDQISVFVIVFVHGH